MRLFRRWSFISLLLVSFFAVAGPLFFTDGSEKSVAAPFSEPSWTGTREAPTLHLSLKDQQRSLTLDWSYALPEQFKIQGNVLFEEAPEKAQLVWITPEGEITLADLGYRERKLDLDARDLQFKSRLGISPFEEAMEVLFPGSGIYRLEIKSPAQPAMVDLDLDITGGKYGILGTDQRGRDVFQLFVSGIRVSLVVGLSATLIATLTGLSLGLISGYAGGIIDAVIMRIVDILLSIPTLPILMALAGIWGRGLLQLVLILSLFSWMGTARTVRSMTLSLREACYIENLRALGAKTSYILYRHLLPETLPLLLANIALGVPGAILAEASLSFLGLSDPRVISWGRMLHEAHSFGAFSSGAWWLLVPPGAGIAFLCLVFLDIGKFLEEMVDPRLKEGQ